MKTYLSMNNRKKKKCFQFPRHLWWSNTGLVVLTFLFNHVWLRDKIRNSLLMTWQLSGSKAFLLMMKMN